MRSFPRTAHRRLAAAAIAAALAMGSVSSTAAADDLKHKQKQVEKKIDHAHDDLHSSSRQLQKAQARLDAARHDLEDARTDLAIARGKLAVAQERDERMQAELEQAEAELDQAQAELLAGRHAVVAQQDVVADTITQIYTEGDPALLAFSSLLESGSAEDLSTRIEANRVFVGTETRQYDDLHAAKVLLEVQKQQVKDARNRVADKRRAAADTLAAMQQLELEAESAKASVLALVGELSAARADARAARAADLQKLRKLQREQARIKEILRKRALRALRNSQSQKGPTGGLLAWPVNGEITSPFGYRVHPIYGYWGLHDGTDFGGGCGLPIHAAESGRVISSYYSPVYGRRMLIDHGALAGAGVATIYNHASSYTVGTGSTVQRGQVIGYTGDTGWSTGCHLHFSVMANGRAVDPQNWL
ncbi:hypothetical protein DDE18_20065 [Nocardioides gansuensis]|uniref:M23ase beta-sheet core domain-containing protein n=1 Tax=Nocardioides gansuensis TaxID=2138300 RepID=A0A2T8F5Y3_9ACTN|nr:M23 family metallopeptidase [Nocardioides gansuensis]PVG81105.1 hypothetical protein DDE18_20065 [Nocardioides gansuensis]